MTRLLAEVLILVVSGLALADGLYLAANGRYHPVMVYSRTLQSAAAIRWEGVGSLIVAFVGGSTVWRLQTGGASAFGMLVVWAVAVCLATAFPAFMAQRAEAATARSRGGRAGA